MSDRFSWFQTPGRTPTLDDPDYQPFFRRHFWPPSALGIVVISIVVSMIVGFVGALIFTSSDNAKIAVDPADQAHVLPTAPPATAPPGPSTTKPLEVLNAGEVARRAGPTVWSVSSLDDAGRAVEGSGFIAGSFGGQTYLLTSLSIVRAATRIPGPDVVVRNGGTEIKATLWTWQEERDLALLVMGRTAPSLPWVDEEHAAKAGDKVYVVGADGSPVAGVVGSVSPQSIQHNVFIDPRRQGAPLVNDKGQILGMASLSFTPGATPTDTVFYAVPIAAACEKVLSCGSGTASVPSTVAPNGPNATTATTTISPTTTTGRATTTTRR